MRLNSQTVSIKSKAKIKIGKNNIEIISINNLVKGLHFDFPMNSPCIIIIPKVNP
ncbi:hypothetical protein KCTCHS21_61460 [Cohnella abietis]|uniref:Uncharacterized protein n=1 Tax=Cohnella abietis TaxID=2507935 RepID=A0A3T1DF37_9BACL|nr:hypothetical protein KCTCHS21_61460 [Cohnella abietis]